MKHVNFFEDYLNDHSTVKSLSATYGVRMIFVIYQILKKITNRKLDFYDISFHFIPTIRSQK